MTLKKVMYLSLLLIVLITGCSNEQSVSKEIKEKDSVIEKNEKEVQQQPKEVEESLNENVQLTWINYSDDFHESKTYDIDGNGKNEEITITGGITSDVFIRIMEGGTTKSELSIPSMITDMVVTMDDLDGDNIYEILFTTNTPEESVLALYAMNEDPSYDRVMEFYSKAPIQVREERIYATLNNGETYYTWL